jgi:hypothetical protein
MCGASNVSDNSRTHEPTAEETKVKVTDKRMFGPDGELREEYRFLAAEEKPEGKPESKAEGEADEKPGEKPPAPPKAAAPDAPRPEPPGQPREAPPGTPPGAAGRGTASFLDLVSVLAEPVAIYLGDVELPDGRSAENLEMARLHIDLLEVLRSKTAGNLTAQEAAVLEDLLYRLRMRYLQKRG